MIPLALLLLSPAWSQPRAVTKAQALYAAGCVADEGGADLALCRKAFDAIRQALRSHPKSPELSVLYAGAELTLGLPNSQTDAERRLRTAIQAKPDWEEPYLLLLGIESISQAQQIDLLRQLLRVNPKATEANRDLTVLLSATPEDTAKYAAEILGLCKQYRTVVPFETRFDLEVDLLAVDRLLDASRVADAATILGAIVDFGLSHDDSAQSACAETLNQNPDDFRGLPEFRAKFLRLRSRCNQGRGAK